MSAKGTLIAPIRRPNGTIRSTITTPGVKSTKLETQWGLITHLEWCEMEASRINQCGGQALVAELDNGEVCICRP